MAWVKFHISALFLSFSVCVFSEGTKELMPDSTLPARILPAQGTIGGQQRDPFAVYNGPEDYRLYIHVKDSSREKIYFGLGNIVSGGNAVTLRIHRPDGSEIFSRTTPTSGTGFIPYYSQAVAGPKRINPVNGYLADSVQPDVNGDYYMTFQIPNNTSREFRYFDISVIDTITNDRINGRVFSKNWQIRNPQQGMSWVCFYAKMYVYSPDSIVTRLDPNGFEGRDFSFACNESGCYAVGPGMPANEARKSANGLHTFPQYKVFLNDPDSNVYPSGTLGMLVQNNPVVQVITNCYDGSIKFAFEVTAAGSGEIVLELNTLGPPFTDRLLSQMVSAGWDTIYWDGYDGSVPPNLVPNNSNVPFSLTYINGMTHLPLYDIENNENGFVVQLVRPVGPEPNFYWDDTGITGNPPMNPGPLVSPPGGCVSSLNPCHLWYGSDPGNLRSINTWWFIANTSTTPVTITLVRAPPAPDSIFGPISTCPGVSGLIYWVHPNPSAQGYVWDYTGTGATITQISDTIISVDFSENATSGNITALGTNVQCGPGLPKFLAVTILPIPDVSIAPHEPVCIDLPSFPLDGGSPPGGSYYINNVPSVTFDPAGLGVGTHMVRYDYADPVTTCFSTDSTEYIVNPLPVVTLAPLSGVCVNIPPYALTGGMPSGGIYSGTGVAGGMFNPSVAGPGTFTITYTYTDNNGCVNADSTPITVYPLSTLTFPPLSPICINAAPLVLNTATPPGGTYSGPGVSGGQFNPATAGVGTHTLTYTFTNLNGCTNSINQTITVTPLPGAAGSISGPDTVCQGTPGVTYTTPAIPDATSYSWTVVPAGAGVFTGNTTTVAMNWATGYYGNATLFVTGVNICGTGVNSGPYPVTVHPKPVVSYTWCTDSVTTTNARPIKLKGGIPPGGTWSGAGVNNPSAGFFNPAVAGPGTHPISYSYTNTYGCQSAAFGNMAVISPPAFSCNNTFTDIRDNKAYPTVQIGTQCWMAVNLNYGSQVTGNLHQRDNCIPEKYCYNDVSANCGTMGGLYQWDEMMQFNETPGEKGLCPPAWHVPTEAEWMTLFVQFNGPGFAGDPLKSTGYSGFDALLMGAIFHNIGWNFMNFATFFWSSTPVGPYKAWAHGMNSYDPSVSWYPTSRTNAFYVRCVKD